MLSSFVDPVVFMMMSILKALSGDLSHAWQSCPLQSYLIRNFDPVIVNGSDFLMPFPLNVKIGMYAFCVATACWALPDSWAGGLFISSIFALSIVPPAIPRYFAHFKSCGLGSSGRN